MDNNTPPAPATSLPATCARRDCDHLAVASPELQCWAIGTPPEQRIEANAARYRLRLPICQLHAASSNVDDFHLLCGACVPTTTAAAALRQ